MPYRQTSSGSYVQSYQQLHQQRHWRQPSSPPGPSSYDNVNRATTTISTGQNHHRSHRRMAGQRALPPHRAGSCDKLHHQSHQRTIRPARPTTTAPTQAEVYTNCPTPLLRTQVPDSTRKRYWTPISNGVQDHAPHDRPTHLHSAIAKQTQRDRRRLSKLTNVCGSP